MGKKIEKTIVMLFSLLLFGLVAALGYGAGYERGLSADVISEKKWETIISKTAQIPAEDTLPFSLYFGDVSLPFDRASGTFLLPVSEEDPLWENGKLHTDTGQALFLKGFAGTDKKKLVADNGVIPFLFVSKEGYLACSLKPVGLPLLCLDASAYKEGETPLYSLRLLSAAKGGIEETTALCSAALRGNTSLTYEKKSLRLRLKKEKDGRIEKKNLSLLSMRKDDDWILNSLYADPSRIRDKLCMDLWKETGARENPYGITMGVEGEFTEVLIDGGYTGLYLLTYPVDRKLLSMDAVSKQLEEGKEPVERIYKKKYNGALSASLFTAEAADPAMRELRGGYLLKGDTVTGEESEWEPLYRVAECFEQPDAEFAARMPELLDVDNTMANWLFYQAICGFDNEYKNHYFVTRRRDGALRGYYIPWDMNLSFGCLYAENVYYSEESTEQINEEVCFEPASRLFHLNAGGAADAADRLWKSWRSGPFSQESLYARMDALMGELTASGAMAREQERWPAGNASPDLSYMKAFTKERLAFVEKLVH